jgi:hypothetical protein
MGFLFDKIAKKENFINIHDEFINPLNETEVVDSYVNSKILKSKYWDKLLYKKKFSHNVVYQIHGNDYILEDGIGKFNFELYDIKNKRILAELILGVNNTKEEKVFNMGHRIVDSKNIGVSGTDFLKKAEEYLKILKNNNKLLAKSIECEVSQPSVLLWLKKNNFSFKKDNFQNPEEFFVVEGQKLVPRLGYRFIKVLDSENSILKDDYVIKEDFILDEDFQKRWKDYLDMKNLNSSKNAEVIINLGKDNILAGQVIDELIKKGYIPRFKLEKEI